MPVRRSSSTNNSASRMALVKSTLTSSTDSGSPMHRNEQLVSPWNAEDTRECVTLWKLTADQETQFLQLRDRLCDVTHWKNNPHEVIRFWHEFQYHHRPVATMEDKFRGMLAWRAEHGVDHVLADYTPPSLFRYFPAGVLVGRDRDGDPIYMERTGAGDTLALLHRYGRDEMIAQAMWLRELMAHGPWVQRYEAETGHPIQQFSVILDLQGLSRRHMSPSLVPVGQHVTRFVQDNYPGFAKRIFVVRAPTIFRWVWSIFRHFVDAHVQKMLVIATEKETEQVLQEYMDLAVLPKVLSPNHGQGQAERGFDPIWEGGPLPDDELLPSEQHQEVRQIMGAAKRNAEITNAVPPEKERVISDGASSTSSWEHVPPPMPPRDTGGDNQQRWSEANFQEMVRAWKFSPKQQQHMRELKYRLRDIQHWKNDPFEVARYYNEFVKQHRHRRPQEHPHHPWSHEFNLEDAEEQADRLRTYDLDIVEEKFRKMINWRIDEDIDNFLERYQPPDPIFHYKPVVVMEGLDRDGDPIYVDRVGMADSYGLLKRTSHRDIIEYIIFIREYLGRRETWNWYEARQGHRPVKMTVIIDLHGLNRAHMRPVLFAVLKEASRISQDMYAGWGKRIILLRAPALFRVIWKLVSHFFDEHISDLIIFTTHYDYAEVLDQFIERDVLPPELGGKGRHMPGYFENVHLEGGPIPSREEIEMRLQSRPSSAAFWVTPTNIKQEQPRSTATPTSHRQPSPKQDRVKCLSSPILRGSWEDDGAETGDNNLPDKPAVRLFPA